MYKLNSLNYPQAEDISISKELSIEPLSTNVEFEQLNKALYSQFGFASLHSFSLSREGFLGLMLELEADIAVSHGESEAVVQAAKLYESLGYSVTYIDLLPNGELDYQAIEALDSAYLFLSPYVMDTFVTVDLVKVKEIFAGSILSNISATLDAGVSDMVYLDAYKLSGYATHSVLLHNEIFAEQNLANIDTVGVQLIADAVGKERAEIGCRDEFLQALQETLGDELLFFVDATLTLDSVAHFGLKGIKAREVIRNLSLASIFVTNGEGCSLGLSKPSRIIQAMGYSELESRQALSLSFDRDYSSEEIATIVSKIGKSYRQIKALHG